MPRVKKNILLKGLSGSFDNTIVIKHYKGRTVISKFPHMKEVPSNQKQQVQNEKFKDAVAFARSVVRNEALKAEYLKKARKWVSLYHYLVHAYMKGKIN